MKKKQLFICLLALLLVVSMSAVAFAVGQYTEIFDGDVIQNRFSQSHTQGNYKITATDTKYYKFTFDNQSVELRTGISLADSFVNLFFGKINIQITDAYDLILSEFSVRCGYSGNVTLKLTKGSTYYIKVTTNLEGYYRLKVNSYADIGGETWEAATETLSVGQMISSIDASGDKDWFYFQTDDTDSFYNFRLENIGGSSTMYMYLYEYVPGAGQTPLRDTLNIYANRGSTGRNEVKLKPNTKYYMCVYLSSGVGGYQLDVTQTLDAVGDTLDTAFAVNTDTNVTTALDGKYDVDWFKFTTKAYDAYYYFNVKDLSLSEYSYISIYDVAGNELKYTGNNGNFGLNIKLQPNTEYYFKINSSYSGTGNYSFTITDIPDPYGNTLAEAGPVRLNETVSESVSGAGDKDFFQFTTLDKDAYYYFNVKDLSLSEYSYVYVYDAAGNELKYAGNNGDISTNLKLQPNTTYYFVIYCSYSGTGNYTVTVTAKDDFYPNERENAKFIQLETTISAAISGAGDKDFFKFTTAAENAYYYFNVKDLSLSEYSYVYVYDAAGNELKYAGNNGDISTNLKLQPNTTYYCMLCCSYSGTGNYTLTINPEYDPEGDVKSQAETIKMNTTYTKKLASSNDVDWYKLTLNGDYNMRFAVTNESGSQKYMTVYSAIDRELVYTYFSGTSQKTTILDAGEYYIKFSGGSGYYTFAAGNCGAGHNEATRCTPASLTASGIKTTYCKSCGVVIKKESVQKVGTITLSATKFTYNGKAQKPTVTIKDAGGKVIDAANYTLSYSSGRTNVGKYSVKVTFKNAYSGTKTLSYSIVAASYSTCTIKLGATSYSYTGKAVTPSVSVKNAAGTTLKKNTDYTVTYASGRTKLGTYKVTVKMKGNYTGTKTLSFKIVQASVSKCTIKLAATSYTYTGKAITPSVTVKNSAGTTLKKNTDYTVTYASGRKNVGTYKVTIKMKGNYTGTKTVTFKIIPKAASISKLTAKSKAIAVKLNRVTTQSTGFQIQYSTSKTFSGAKTTTVKSYKTSSVTLSKLKAKTTYYVRVRTYKTVNGTKIYSNWSTAKSIKTK